MAEAMLGEPADVSRVMFVPDYNTASAVMHRLYQTQGQIWTLVVPKIDMIPDLFTLEEASSLLQQGALRMNWTCYDADRQRVILTAIGAYQLEEVLKASARLRERKVPHTVIYMLEPGRFRTPRSEREKASMAAPHLLAGLYPPSVPARIFVTHTRPESLLGVLQPLHTGTGRTEALGYINHGGTLSVPGILFVNRCTWAHILLEAALTLGLPREDLLTPEEIAVLDGIASPEEVIF